MVHNRKEVPADLAGVDAVVFGHSHKYVQEEKDGVLWLNPGSCGPRRFHQEITMMTAEAEDGKIRVEKVIIPTGRRENGGKTASHRRFRRLRRRGGAPRAGEGTGH